MSWNRINPTPLVGKICPNCEENGLHIHSEPTRLSPLDFGNLYGAKSQFLH